MLDNSLLICDTETVSAVLCVENCAVVEGHQLLGQRRRVVGPDLRTPARRTARAPCHETFRGTVFSIPPWSLRR